MASTTARNLPFPRQISIAITGRCNLSCRYCFYADEMVALSDLPTERWLTFFEELKRLAVFQLTLTGGEVFTRPDLFDLIDGLIENRMRYSLLSNGTLITEKTLEKFEVGKRRLRLDSVQISIDGASAEIHNSSRPNSFERALRGLRLLTSAGFPVTVRVTINKHNLHDLENIVALLLDDIGLPSISTNEAIPLGSGCHHAKEIALSAADQAEAIQTMARLLERYPGRLRAQAGPQAKLKMYAEMELARRTGQKTTRWQMGYLSACGCVFSQLDIMHDGTIVPCHMLPTLTLGNIMQDSIEEIWRTHPLLQTMYERRTIPMQQVEGCEGCEWASYCNGSCPGLAYQQTKDLKRANPYDCYRAFLEETGGVDVIT